MPTAKPRSPKIRDTSERISMTLPGSTLLQLDAMLQERGFANRSQAVTGLINRELVDFGCERDGTVMTGTITLFYGNRPHDIRAKLAMIQRQHIAEVISSLHVLLEDDHTMEVLVVQGPARKLRAISDELVTCKGVKTGSLNLSTFTMPPIHSKS
jgi:CopG family nickel-responsive transcriptional regulator